MARQGINIHYVELKKAEDGSLEEVFLLRADDPTAKTVRIRRSRGRRRNIAGAKHRVDVDRKTGDVLEILSCFIKH